MSVTDLEMHVWIPCPDCAPLHLRTPADTLALSGACLELPRFGILLALLDADQRVEMIVLNPSVDLVMNPDRIERTGIPRPVRGVALFTIASQTDQPPLDVFTILRARYGDAGIRLVDWVRIQRDEGLTMSMRIVARHARGTVVDYLRAGTCV